MTRRLFLILAAVLPATNLFAFDDISDKIKGGWILRDDDE